MFLLYAILECWHSLFLSSTKYSLRWFHPLKRCPGLACMMPSHLDVRCPRRNSTYCRAEDPVFCGVPWCCTTQKAFAHAHVYLSWQSKLWYAVPGDRNLASLPISCTHCRNVSSPTALSRPWVIDSLRYTMPHSLILPHTVLHKWTKQSLFFDPPSIFLRRSLAWMLRRVLFQTDMHA